MSPGEPFLSTRALTLPGAVFAALVVVAALVGCTTSQSAVPNSTVGSTQPPTPFGSSAPGGTDPGASDTVATFPPDTGPNVYSHIGPNDMSPNVADALPLIYVPSNDDGSVTVIDPTTRKVVNRYKVGTNIQHVVPDWNLKTLYATASGSNQLVPFDPTTGKPGKGFQIDAPYNLYFTPDGSTAIVMAERRRRMNFYHRRTWKLIRSVDTGTCDGINHADWSPDGSFFLATCEFSGEILKVQTATGEIVNRLKLQKDAMPQDLRIVPDGSKFYVADMMHAEIVVLSADGTKVIGHIRTAKGTHGIYPSRDAKLMYVTNRGRLAHDTTRKSHDGEGSVSVVDPSTDTVVATWQIPGGGSPDMGGVSADGSTFWVSGRFDDVVYAFDTASGELTAKIKVPGGPHGLCVFPQPGRYSLGHTGNYR